MTTKREIDRKTVVVQQLDDVLVGEVDDELVMTNLAAEKYYGMDAVGARIWQLMAEPRQVSAICDELLQEFDVDRATCESDVMEFVGQLIEAKIVKIVKGA